jgi:hypothetical protein
VAGIDTTITAEEMHLYVCGAAAGIKIREAMPAEISGARQKPDCLNEARLPGHLTMTGVRRAIARPSRGGSGLTKLAGIPLRIGVVSTEQGNGHEMARCTTPGRRETEREEAGKKVTEIETAGEEVTEIEAAGEEVVAKLSNQTVPMDGWLVRAKAPTTDSSMTEVIRPSHSTALIRRPA